MSDSFRARIQPQLLSWYDASPGFDFEHLEELVSRTKAQELGALRPDPAVRSWETELPGLEEEAPPIKLRIYEPAQRQGTLPVLLFFHGGGFLFGTVYRQEALCQRYVKGADCMVVSVEYRLAPRWKAPAPVEDAYAALLWVREQGENIGADGDRIAAAGLSAGGTIVAALAMMTRDRGGPQLCLQMPLYGEMDWRMRTKSAQEIQDPKVWCYENNKTSWNLYLEEDKAVHYYDSPALCRRMKDLPPLFSYVGGLDPVRDENMEFWMKLMQAGVPVEGHVFPGAYHCFELGSPDAACSQQAYALSMAALRRAFGTD